MILTGSICLSDIPREQMKKVICKDGKEKIYLNVAVIERKEGIQYIFGDFKEYKPIQSSPTPEHLAEAPGLSPQDDLPF